MNPSHQSYDVVEQYRTSGNLDTRITLHERFSKNTYGWMRWVFDQIELPAGSHLLELGCGVGKLWLENRERIPESWQIVLSDFSLGMLESTQRNLQDLAHVIRFEQIDAESIPFADGQFDGVIANHMLYYVDDKAQAFSEIWRVLKPGGVFYASTIGRHHLRELKELVGRFEFNPLLTNLESIEQSFLLETGMSQMAEWFPNVFMRRYEDTLLVTEVEPLVDYVMSSEVLRVENRAGFADYLQEQLDAQQGTIQIHKDSGIFIASKQV